MNTRSRFKSWQGTDVCANCRRRYGDHVEFIREPVETFESDVMRTFKPGEKVMLCPEKKDAT